MGRYQPFHDLPASQYEALKRDVDARGIVNPILVDEHDKTIDGHQRRKVAADLGIECPRIVVEGLSDDDKMSLALALNTFRRHLTGVERSGALQKMSQLGMSQRRIAEATGLGLGTVNRALAGVPDGTPEAPPGVDPDTGEIKASSSSGQSDGTSSDAAGSGDDERDATPAPSPTPKPAPRVVGKDGKSYPATKSPAVESIEDQVSKSDVGYRASVSREFSKVRSGLLTLDAQRVAQVCATDDRDAYLAFAADVGAWVLELTAWLKETKLRSVK